MATVSSARVDAFLIEARNAAQLDHRGIVTVYDVVEREGVVGEIFVVMEYVNGSTLHDLLRTERHPAQVHLAPHVRADQICGQRLSCDQDHLHQRDRRSR